MICQGEGGETSVISIPRNAWCLTYHEECDFFRANLSYLRARQTRWTLDGMRIRSSSVMKPRIIIIAHLQQQQQRNTEE